MTVKSLFIAFFLMFSLSCYSQIRVEKQANQWLTNNLERINVDYFSQGGSGNQIWDFSELNIGDGSTEKLSYRLRSDSAFIINTVNVRSFILKKDTLYQVETESPLHIIHYIFPVCRLIYPYAYGDSTTIPFYGKGIYCNDHIYREGGQTTLLADAYGKIILPNRDTLQNVIRLYTLRSYFICMDIDSIALDTARLHQVIEEHYEWYARGYRYPVFETFTSTTYAGMKMIGTKQQAYCCLPDFQNQLFDPVNKAIHKNDSIEQIKKQDIFHYQTNVQGMLVHVDYNLDEKAEITMLISNTMGIVYRRLHRSQIARQGYSESIDCNGLRRGQYILYINVNGRIYSKTITF